MCNKQKETPFFFVSFLPPPRESRVLESVINAEKESVVCSLGVGWRDRSVLYLYLPSVSLHRLHSAACKI